MYINEKIYVCDLNDGNTKFYIKHEIAHAIYSQLTTKDKEIYLEAYQDDIKYGIKRFYREYEMSDVEEDFCTNYSLMKI